MAEPSPKSTSLTNFLEELSGRTTAIKAETCVDRPFGCGGPVEGTFQNDLERREYTISGMCGKCQRDFFNGSEDDYEPTDGVGWPD